MLVRTVPERAQTDPCAVESVVLSGNTMSCVRCTGSLCVPEPEPRCAYGDLKVGPFCFAVECTLLTVDTGKLPCVTVCSRWAVWVRGGAFPWETVTVLTSFKGHNLGFLLLSTSLPLPPADERHRSNSLTRVDGQPRGAAVAWPEKKHR